MEQVGSTANPIVWCDSCQRWLRHDTRYCPLFPDISPPMTIRRLKTPIHTPIGIDTYEHVRAEKWDRCACLVHTCHDAQPKLVRMSTENGLKFHLALHSLNPKPLCGRGIWFTGGHVVTQADFEHSYNMCSNCRRAWLQCRIYKDFL